jgi:squalene cyclase
MIQAGQALVASQNADGGWGAQLGRASSTETTALATLALGRLDSPDARASAAQGVRWLGTRQHDDGGWPVSAHVAEGSWATALAVLALDALGREPAAVVRGARWLLRRTPRTLGLTVSLLHRFASSTMAVRLDPDLKGWSWTADATSFVEPTCHVLLALKRLRRQLPGAAVTERIDEAERMIYDRMCRDGGWNYGNSVVLDAELWPYADVTALALLALVEHRQREANQRSLRALRAMLQRVDSGLALAWTTLCLSAHDEDVVPLRERLARRYALTGFLGETKVVALALLALSDGAAVFRV